MWISLGFFQRCNPTDHVYQKNKFVIIYPIILIGPGIGHSATSLALSLSFSRDLYDSSRRVDHAVVIHGVGLDEISPLGPATILEIKNTAPEGEPKTYTQQKFTFDPLTVGIPRCDVLDLKGGGPVENADEFRKVLLGGSHTNAKRDSIVLNAGVGVYVYGLTESIEEGCKLARKTLESGKATEVLEKWVETSQAIRAEETA